MLSQTHMLLRILWSTKVEILEVIHLTYKSSEIWTPQSKKWQDFLFLDTLFLQWI